MKAYLKLLELVNVNPHVSYWCFNYGEPEQ